MPAGRAEAVRSGIVLAGSASPALICLVRLPIAWVTRLSLRARLGILRIHVTLSVVALTRGHGLAARVPRLVAGRGLARASLGLRRYQAAAGYRQPDFPRRLEVDPMPSAQAGPGYRSCRRPGFLEVAGVSRRGCPLGWRGSALRSAAGCSGGQRCRSGFESRSGAAACRRPGWLPGGWPRRWTAEAASCPGRRWGSAVPFSEGPRSASGAGDQRPVAAGRRGCPGRAGQ